MRIDHDYINNKTVKIKDVCPGETFKFSTGSSVYMKTNETDSGDRILCLNLMTGIIAICSPADSVTIVECLLTVYDKKENKKEDKNDNNNW